MSVVTEHNLPHPLGIALQHTRPQNPRTGWCAPTTGVERALLVTTVALFPLEGMMPVFGGFSSAFILFLLLAAYSLIYRPSTVLKTARHPLFLASYVFLTVGFLIESLHAHKDYSELLRVGLMVGGGILVGTLCRDKKALRAALVALVILGIWMSVVLIITTYSGLSSAKALDFDEASRVREGVLASNPLLGNANSMAFITGQGVVVALVLALHAADSLRRYLYFGVIGLGMVATFLPLSRSGIVITIVSCATVMLIHKGKKLRVILAAIVLGIAVLTWVPEVVFARLTFSTQHREGKQEARAGIYTAAVEHAPEYALVGVGAGNFWRLWGYNHGWRSRYGVLGAHNCLIAVTIYWGVMGLAAFVLMIVQAYRCLPRSCGNDALALCLLGIGLSLLLLLNVTHALYAKEFSIGLGLLVGARRWIWPDGICRTAE